MSEQSLPPVPSPEVVRKNRRLLLILLATFIIPFVIGDLAYNHRWYKGAQTNKGQLIAPPAAFADFRAQDSAGKLLGADFAQKSWWLLYVMPAQCDGACRNRLFQMRQVRRALGKEAERVRQVVVMTAAPDSEATALLTREFPDFVQIKAAGADVDTALKSATAGASRAGLLYIMDPMGWIMLAYPPEADEKTSVTRAEDILKDLQKLLKASRIG